MTVAELIKDARTAAELSQAELARRANTSQSAVNRYERGIVVPSLPTLERLLEACGRSLELTSVPAARRTRRPPGPPGRRALLRRHRRKLLEAARRRGARRVLVFGSVVRGEDRAGSDVDLLVELPAGYTLVDLAALRREASEILGVPVDVATPEMLTEGLRRQAVAEAVPL